MDRYLHCILLTVCLIFATNRLAFSDEAYSWKASAASVAITPNQPVWMAGYASRDKPSDGIIHDLYAKVLILKDATGGQAAIVTLDLIGVTPALRAQVEERVAKLGIPPESLVMNASHTHCGPELRGERLVRFGIDPMYAAISDQYVRDTAKAIADLVERTSKQLVPAKLSYSFARAGFAMNRRLPTNDSFANSPNPDGPVDSVVPVLRVENNAKQTMAILFGYSCHNTTLSFNQLCGDYAGFAQAILEAKYPGTVAMFVNGCSGDQNPYPRRSLELAEQHGQTLANAVDTALETKIVRPIVGPLSCAMENVTLEFAPAPTSDQVRDQLQSSNRLERIHGEAMQEQLSRLGRIPTTYDTFPIQVLQFGTDLTFVAICGEVVVDYGIRLKKELNPDGKSVVWVAGYSNYVFGYLPSQRVLREGGYEGGGAMLSTTFPGPFDDSVEDRVISKVHELAKRVRIAKP